MYNLLKIKLNDALWTENEREELIDRALQIHLEKRRRVQLDEPAFKRQRYNNDDKSLDWKSIVIMMTPTLIRLNYIFITNIMITYQ